MDVVQKHEVFETLMTLTYLVPKPSVLNYHLDFRRNDQVFDPIDLNYLMLL